jgi:hypothetical protein
VNSSSTQEQTVVELGAVSGRDADETSANRLNTLLLGGCMIRWPILRTPICETKLKCDPYGRLTELHTFGEIFQLLGLLQGTSTVPKEIRPLARIPLSVRPAVSAQKFQEIDVALVAPSSPIELTFRGFSVNRLGLLRAVAAQIPGDAPLGPRLLHRWMKPGLEGLNESIRIDAATKLLALMGGGGPATALARAVVEETRSERAEMMGNLRALRDLLGRPLGVVLYYFHYMPDGRPLSWPAGFHDELVTAANGLSIPLFDPAPLVLQYGPDSALKDARHYSRAFLPVAGDALAQFARSVFEGTVPARSSEAFYPAASSS